jgi:predicted esterase
MMRTNILMIIYLLATAFTPHAAFAGVAVECYGSDKAKNFIAYLHGLDSIAPSTQELANRKLLKALADQLGFRLAIARSDAVCNKSLCWRHNEPDEHSKTYRDLMAALEKCKPRNAHTLGLVGFSNGGYFTSKVTQFCYKDGPKWIIASGSAGSWNHTYHGDKSSCPSIAIMIGEGDLSREKAERYAKFLISSGYKGSFTTFKGRHELFHEPLKKQLKAFLTN